MTDSAHPHPILLVPGIGNSGPAHWQSLWQQRYPAMYRVSQRDWDNPVRDEWVSALDRAIGQVSGSPILVGHSLGCLVVADWAAQSNRRDLAILLVAVPDPDGPAFPRAAVGFESPSATLRNHRVVVVSSRDDPYATPSYSASLAKLWGAAH